MDDRSFDITLAKDFGWKDIQLTPCSNVPIGTSPIENRPRFVPDYRHDYEVLEECLAWLEKGGYEIDIFGCVVESEPGPWMAEARKDKFYSAEYYGDSIVEAVANLCYGLIEGDAGLVRVHVPARG